MGPEHGDCVNAVSRQAPIENVPTGNRDNMYSVSKFQRQQCCGDSAQIRDASQDSNIMLPLAKSEQGLDGDPQTSKDLRLAERREIGQRAIGPNGDHLPAIVYKAKIQGFMNGADRSGGYGIADRGSIASETDLISTGHLCAYWVLAVRHDPLRTEQIVDPVLIWLRQRFSGSFVMSHGCVTNEKGPAGADPFCCFMQMGQAARATSAR